MPRDPAVVRRIVKAFSRRKRLENRIAVALRDGPYDGCSLQMLPKSFYDLLRKDLKLFMPLDDQDRSVAVYRVVPGPVRDSVAKFVGYGERGSEELQDCGDDGR